MTAPDPGLKLTTAQLAKIMNVSVRGIRLAGELQRCNRPDIEARIMSGEIKTLREALRIAKPEKYAKRDKVEQWLAQFRAWSPADRLRGLAGLAPMIEEDQ